METAMNQDRSVDRFMNCALGCGLRHDNNMAPWGSQCTRVYVLAFVLLAAAVWFCPAGHVSGQDMHHVSQGAASDDRSVQTKIALAMSAGPPGVAHAARVVDMDASGKMVVLREGHNGFTRMPAHGDASPAMCADEASMQWFADFAAHKPKRIAKRTRRPTHGRDACMRGGLISFRSCKPLRISLNSLRPS